MKCKYNNEEQKKFGFYAAKVCFFTFFVLLDGWGWAGHLHGQTVGSAEGMAVPYDERPGLPVLQQVDGWVKKRGGGRKGSEQRVGRVAG